MFDYEKIRYYPGFSSKSGEQLLDRRDGFVGELAEYVVIFSEVFPCPDCQRLSRSQQS